ncbi:adult-specific rigid cuticular protein 15.7-like [Tropilaelaps mercedesae]|uniref:Adult-specific rigid cuticular protein 15.7-like n=1 Tax=Tropilaelaps mercedesae TaxID=418985 RepID=A0A1V9WZ59_9ACAR|nr:adult-specific rigid cuticular protein 15.7-like [Tropilaelaps mercedesae]
MFRLVAAIALFSMALAGHHGSHGGHSTNLRHQDDYGNYEFKYDIKDGYGNVNGRQEKGSHGHVLGAYYLGEIDGRHRSVEYQADKLGFKATIKTNEPGTKTSEPAFAPYINTAYGKSIPSVAIHTAHGYNGYGGHH